MSSNIEVMRICQYCTKEFTARTTTTKYCSKKCNSAHYKAKIRAKNIEQSNNETTRIINKPISDIQAKEILTVKDVSLLLGCSLRTAYRFIENGTLKAVNLAERMTRVKKSDLNKLMEQPTPKPVIKEPE